MVVGLKNLGFKQNDIIGYYDNRNRLVVRSMMYKINTQVVEALQFAKTLCYYKLKLGYSKYENRVCNL